MPVNPRWERYTTPRYFQAGEAISREGGDGDAVYIVRRGQVVITKDTPSGDPLVLNYRGPGDLVGEIALISDAPRTASIIATRPSELLAISPADFWDLLRSDEEFRQVVMETLIDHLLVADQSRLISEMWERSLEARFSTLTTENERMAEIMQLRQETMRFIIHDLRNPLHLAMTALSMIELEPEYDPGTDSGRFVTMAQGSLARMLNLVDALLDLGRLEAGEAELNLEAVDMVALIGEAVEVSKPIALTNRVTLVNALPEDAILPHVPADAQRIERVVMNLIDNAIRFARRDATVTISARHEEDRLVVSVSDTGPGIAPDQRERIFDRFVQTETGRGSSGFGLGLAFCRMAVEAHGGTIRAEAGEEGIGTRITFTLPLRSAADARSQQIPLSPE